MKYQKNGKYGKFLGFNYYLRYETKMRPNEREDFLIRSEEYINKINELSKFQFPYMDENLNDLELMEQWNQIWHQWGWVMDKFKDKWINERIGK